MYTIAKYLRISTEDIDMDGFGKFESNSIGNQRALLDDYISKMPETDVQILEMLDDGRTGTNFVRPGAQKIIEMAQSGEIQCIIVKDLSRWGRNFLEVGDFLEQKFPAWGVRFISINDMYDSALLNGTTGGIDTAFKNLIYEMYSQDLSEKVRAAKMSLAKQGKNSNAQSFYGYIKDPQDVRKFVIDEPAAKIVKRIFDLTCEGITASHIAKMLNDEGVLSPQKRKMELGSKRRWRNSEISFWYGSIISLILRDERYTGKWIYGKTRKDIVSDQKLSLVPKDDWIVVDNAIPAIISQEQYDKARVIATGRSRPKANHSKTNLIFAGKLKCSYCGKGMRATHKKDSVKYSCDTRRVTKAYGCKDFIVLEKDIYITVLAALQQRCAFADKARKDFEAKLERLTPNIESLTADISKYERLIEKTETSKMGLWEKFQTGQISAEGFQGEIEKADKQIEHHITKISHIKDKISKLEMESGQENIFVERFSRYAGLNELTREIIMEFIKEIKIFSQDKIEIVFSYGDEYYLIEKQLSAKRTKS